METVTLKTFNNYFSANILLSRLQSAGIPCFLKDDFTVTIDPILTNAIGGIKVVVPIAQEAEARKELHAIEQEYLNNTVCPKCASRGMISVPKTTAPNMITAIFSWLFSGFAVAPDYVFKCNNCGHETPDLPDPVDTGDYLNEGR